MKKSSKTHKNSHFRDPSWTPVFDPFFGRVQKHSYLTLLTRFYKTFVKVFIKS
jgi:hypothetical protein